jgi:hypothetical protein
MVGVFGQFCSIPFSAFAGLHDNGDLICLTRRAVNTPNPSMKSERVVL